MACGKCDLMVLISSDSDFTSTVRELREAGIYTIGVGERKTPRPLQNAYNEFWFLDEFVSTNKPRANKKVPAAKKPSSSKLRLDDIVAREIQKLQRKQHRNWILVSQLGVELKAHELEFDVGVIDFIRNHKDRFILTKDKETAAWLVAVDKNF